MTTKRIRLPRKRCVAGPGTEHATQKGFFDYLAKKHPVHRAVCFSIPNDGARSLIHGCLLKQRGLTRGVPDVFCAIPSEDSHGLFIEFKNGSNTTSREQDVMIKNLRLNGYRCEICYSLKEAMDIFEVYI